MVRQAVGGGCQSISALWPSGGGGGQGCRREGASEAAQRWLDRPLEEVAKAVGGGYCRLQMPLKLALGVTWRQGGQRLSVGWCRVQLDMRAVFGMQPAVCGVQCRGALCTGHRAIAALTLHYPTKPGL